MRISRKSKTRLLTTVGGLCCLFGSIGVGAQQTEPLPVGSALNVTSFGQLVPIEFSPDGKWLAYTVQENLRSKSADFEALARTGVPVWGEGTDINISSVESGQARNLTGGKGNNWLPAWSPNGAYLAFFSDRDGSGHARVWVWDVANDELKKISNVEVRGNEIKWTPDSRRVLVTAIPQGISVDEYARITSSPRDDDRAASTETPGSRVYVYQSGGSSGQKRPMSDPWNLDWVIRDLVSIEVATGQALPLVHLKRIEEYRLSPDGSRLAFTLPKRFEKPGSQQILFDLVMVNLATQQERVVASDIRLDYDGASFSWSPDGIHLSFQLGGVEEQVRDCYVVDLKDGASHNVSALPMPRLGSPYRSWAPLWDRKGEYVYYIHDGALWRSSLSQSKGKEIAHVPNRQILKVVAQSENVLWAPGDGKSAIVLTIDQLGKQDGFYQLDLDGRTIAKLLEKGECYTCANVVRGEFTAVARDGRKVAYMAEDAVHDRDLWMGDSTFRNTRR